MENKQINILQKLNIDPKNTETIYRIWDFRIECFQQRSINYTVMIWYVSIWGQVWISVLSAGMAKYKFLFSDLLQTVLSSNLVEADL